MLVADLYKINKKYTRLIRMDQPEIFEFFEEKYSIHFNRSVRILTKRKKTKKLTNILSNEILESIGDICK